MREPAHGGPSAVRHVPPGGVRWVATPPGAVDRSRAGPDTGSAGPRHYAGPPSYARPPRWGFPHVVWRASTSVPGTASAAPLASQRLLLIARNALAVLWALVALATVAAGAEFWRYALLVLSRNTALSPAIVGASDALVLTFSLLTFVLMLFAFAATVWWLFVARTAAADEAGHAPPRSAREVLLGVLVPGVNLVVAGSVLAELEHAATRQPANRRPRPSRLVCVWWAAWVTNAVLVVLTVIWRLRDGVQAQADAVVLTGLADASAAALAALTALLVRRFTRLLAPMEEELVRPPRVVRVDGAPELPRRPRPATSTR